MALQVRRPKCCPRSFERTKSARRQAIVDEVNKTGDKDRDLIHGDGGTLGLGRPEDLSHDD
jgi:hypothetical protein